MTSFNVTVCRFLNSKIVRANISHKRESLGTRLFYIVWSVTEWCSTILTHFRENPKFMLCMPFTTIQPSRLLRIILIIVSNIMYVHVDSFYY